MRSRWLFNGILALCVLGIAIGVGGLLYESARGGAASGLSASAVEATNELLASRREVVAAMGKHPDTEAVFGELVALWRADTGWEEGAIRRKVVEAFPNEDLGLYALRGVFEMEPAAEADAFGASLIASRPDSRVACMALDRQLKADEAGAVSRCEVIVAEGGKNRLHRFGLTRLGDFHEAAGRHPEAQYAWYRAWALDPASGPQLHNKLYQSWLASGDWFAPAILGADYLDDPALVSLLERLAARCAPSAPPLSPVEEQLAALGAPLGSGDLKAVCDSLGALSASWAEWPLSEEVKADYAQALFLLGGKGGAASLPLEEALLLRNEFDGHRRKFLELSRTSWASLAPDLRALYTLRAAERHFESIQAKAAAAVLKDSWKDGAISRPWRERLLTRYADTLEKDLNRPRDAAVACAEYCDGEPAHGEDLRARAGLLYFRVEAYPEALDTFEALGREAKTEFNTALSLYMRGLCHGQLGDQEIEERLLEETVETQGQSDFAPQALERLSAIAFARGERGRALERLEDIQSRYAEWEGIARVQSMMASIQAKAS